MTSWRDRNAANPVPGMTEARVWKIATEDGKYVLMVWGDFEQTMNTKDTISVGGGQVQSETVVSKDGRRLEWQCEVKDNVLSITINKQTFDPAQGTLFLVSTGKTTKVGQLKRDTHLLKLDEEQLKALVQQDVEIEEFFLEGQRRNNQAK